MKKTISLLLTFMLLLTFAACGNKQDNFLTKTSWTNIYDESDTFTFKADGTGTFGNISTTWSLENSRLTVSYMGTIRTMTIEFDIVEFENSTIIIECPNDIVDTKILVSSDNYATESEKVINYLNTAATPLDWDTVYDEYLLNKARAAEKYTGTIVKWTAKVYYISDNFCQMAIEASKGSPVNPIEVYMETSELTKFNIYDEITVIGILEMDSASTQINGAFVVD